MNFVLSGDVVNSSSLSVKEKDKLQLSIKTYVDKLVNNHGVKYQIIFYRGDAFQILCDNEYHAVSLTIGLRCIAKSFSPKGKSIDVRVSLALGDIDRWASDDLQAEGEALTMSGKGLDLLSNSDRRIKIYGFDRKEKARLNFADARTYALILDHLIKDWSVRQAETISYALLDMKQKEIAKVMKTKQNAISRFLKIAKWDIIQSILIRFRAHVSIQEP